MLKLIYKEGKNIKQKEKYCQETRNFELCNMTPPLISSFNILCEHI